MPGVKAPGTASLKRSIGRLYVLLTALNLIAWGLAWLAFARHPALLGTALLAYTFGLRHAVDADHICAIDNVTRKLIQEGSRPIGVGLFFSLGHATIVFGLTIAIAIASQSVQRSLPILQHAGGIIGTSVSAAFLLLVAAVNAVVLAGVLQALRDVRRGRPYQERLLDDTLDRRGVLWRIFRPIVRLVDRSWKMYPVGMLFGLGFDTATEVGLLGIAAVAAGKGLPIYDILLFPLLFAAGMSLLDTSDGVLMLGAYGWAFVDPVRKLHYNAAITLASVVVAAIIGTMEASSVLSAQFGWSGGAWNVVNALGDHLGALGFAVVGALGSAWMVATLVYRRRTRPSAAKASR